MRFVKNGPEVPERLVQALAVIVNPSIAVRHLSRREAVDISSVAIALSPQD